MKEETPMGVSIVKFSAVGQADVGEMEGVVMHASKNGPVR